MTAVQLCIAVPAPREALHDAIRLVCADLRLMDVRRADIPDHALIDLADDIADDEIRDALRDGEITAATADAYRQVWDAPSADLNAALVASRRGPMPVTEPRPPAPALHGPLITRPSDPESP